MPTFTVFESGPGSASSGQRKSFQVAVIEKIETTPRIGREIGSTTDQSVLSGPAPSTAAADSSSSGTESKNRLSRNTLNAVVTAGSQIAHGVSSRFQPTNGSALTVTYCGMTRTVDGIISVASISPRATLPNLGRSLENEYAAATWNTSWKASAPNA